MNLKVFDSEPDEFSSQVYNADIQVLDESLVDVHNLQRMETQNSEASDKGSHPTVKIAFLNVVPMRQVLLQ
jgi:hypothetical protein